MKASKPLIGVSVGFHDYGDYVAIGFERPIAQAGGVPVILPRLPEAVGELLDRCNGLVLTGGRDVVPENYGQAATDALGRTDPRRDSFEFELVTEALRRELPILAFCRGMQVLNVACGGTLIQDVRQAPGWADHPTDPDLVAWRALVAASFEGRLPQGYPRHRISIDRDSLLFASVRVPEAEVTSFHHQAVGLIGTGLQVTARAADGVPEALEGGGFVLGVQFELHEDARLNPAFQAVFTQFVAAAIP